MASQGFESSVVEVDNHPEEALLAEPAKGGQDADHDPLFDGEFPEDTPGEPDASAPSSLTLNQELFGDDDDDLFGESQDEPTPTTSEHEPAHTSPAPLSRGLALPTVRKLALPTNSSASRVEQATPTQSEVAPATTTSTPRVEPTAASRFPPLALPRVQPLALPTLPAAPRVEQQQPALSEAPIESPATGSSAASPSTIGSEPTGANQAPEAPQGSRKRKRDDEAGEPESSKKKKKQRASTVQEQWTIEQENASTEMQIQVSRISLPEKVARHSKVVSRLTRKLPVRPKKGTEEHPIEIGEGEAGPAPREEPSGTKEPTPPASSSSEAGSSSQDTESTSSSVASASSPASAPTPPSPATSGSEVETDKVPPKTAAELHGSLEEQMAEAGRNMGAYANSEEAHRTAKREKKKLKMQKYREGVKARKEMGLK